MFRLIVVLGLVFTLTFGASIAEAGKKKKKGKAVRASVVAVETAKEADKGGTLTVKVLARKKDTEAKPEEKKFTVTKDTKFVSVTGKKGSQEEKPAVLGDVKSGSMVMIQGSETGAEKVLIRAGKKAKKKKNVS